jgi:hypothetical protein
MLNKTKYNNWGKQIGFVGFEVLTVVAKKDTIFWYVMLCSLVKVQQPFIETYCLQLQG